jgi:hypothetical protein
MQKLILGDLPKLVDGVAGNILSYALILAAVATITMAFLELIKAVFKLRFKYHLSKVQKWIHDDKAFEQLIVLTVAKKDAEEALFDQPTDKLMAQIQAAANIAVDFPDTYPALYEFFACNPLDQGGLDSDAAIWKNFISQTLVTPDAKSPLVQRATRARTSIDHFVSRRLDAFQTRTEYLWARKNQYWSVAASTLFLTVLLVYIGVPLVWAILLAGFGGMMAPFAKDIVTALSGLRTK